MKIRFVTLGCKLNFAESSAIGKALLQRGHTRAKQGEEADICVINTCSVTDNADHKDRQTIHRIHRQNPNAIIIVTGCYAQLKKAEIESIEGVTAVFGATEKSLIVPTILAQTKGREFCDRDMSTFFPAYSSGERTRSFLKVQDGCDYKCHYCTVPYARGESRNIPIAEIIPQAEAIAAEGIKEIVITGVNTGDFGRSSGETFFELIQKLNSVEGIERYRISSIEPNLLTHEMIDWITSGSKFLPHYHIPLQSGCDTILKAMGRRYDTDAFAEKIQYIRSRSEFPGGPKVFFGIDVIVGFPGESEEDFADTMDILDQVEYDNVYAFLFSPREGTRASKMDGEVAREIKDKRMAKLLACQDKISLKLNTKYESTVQRVLVDNVEKRKNTSIFSGRTLTNKLVYFTAEKCEIGEFINVKITKACPYHLLGEAEM